MPATPLTNGKTSYRIVTCDERRFLAELRRSGTRTSVFERYGRSMANASTPWGPAEVVEEVTVPQRAGEKRFATVVQLLASRKAEELVRFAYSTAGTARRGPVTFRARDLERLRAALAEHPGLAHALGLETSKRSAEGKLQQM